ncbi:hypothetical protein F4781DRAFT_335900 [Annulohypoxylon bovei var. microspora]|nr:hypothetical protein F4781DRAFT_335900 [Annulohypoxylon bovei var. microspora]
MSSDLSWEPEYCLACDRQTDGATYCSESCRLSDFEKTSSTASTPVTTPGLTSPSSYNWTAPRPQAKFFLPPAYDFSNAQPYGSTPLPQSYLSQRSESSSSSSARVLTPSSSHSSLCSLQSTSSSGSEGSQLSDKAKKQLRDYASSFEHTRLQQSRRRSY